jgi:hypothetical protein
VARARRIVSRCRPVRRWISRIEIPSTRCIRLISAPPTAPRRSPAPPRLDLFDRARVRTRPDGSDPAPWGGSVFDRRRWSSFQATPTVRPSGRPGQQWNLPLAFRALPRRSSQIAAYRRTSARIADRGRPPRRYETPASRHLCRWPVSKMGLIAMQKVVGSNPISRFASNSCTWAGRPSRGIKSPAAYHLHGGSEVRCPVDLRVRWDQS